MEILIIAILLGLIPAMVAQSKGRSFVPWWIYGSLLFLIALPHALLLKPEIKEVEQQQAAQGFKKCPFCAEMIKPDAKVCRYCGRNLSEGDPPPRPEPSAPPSEVPPNDPSAGSGSPLPESGSFPKARVWTPPPWEQASTSRPQSIPPSDDPGENIGSVLTAPDSESKSESWPPPSRKSSDADARLDALRLERRRAAGRRSRALALIVISVIAAFALVGTGAYILGRRSANNAGPTAPSRASVPSPTQETASTPSAAPSRDSAPLQTQEAATPTPAAPSRASSLSQTRAAPAAPTPSRVLAPSPTQEAARDSTDHTPRAVGAEKFSGGCAARLPADQRITLNLKDANIQTTLRLFAQQYRVNMVSTDDVKGTITLDFFRVPVREAFQTIIDTGNLRCVLTGEVLRVSTASQSKEEATAPPSLASAPLPRATPSLALSGSTTGATRATTQLTALTASQQPGVPNIVLQGRGQQLTRSVPLHMGLVVAELTHNGQRNFITTLLDSGGNHVQIMTNVVGPFTGSTAFGVRADGNYAMNVQADGQWTIRFRQPGGAPETSTTSFSGVGQTATPMFSLAPGLRRFALSHAGSRNFIVILLDAQGRHIDIVTNAIGSFDGSKGVQVRQNGAYILNVQADGPWTITVE